MKKLFILLAVAMIGMSHNAQAQSLQQFHNAFMNYAANSWANYQNQMMQNAWQMQHYQQQMQQQWANGASWDNVNNYNHTQSTYNQSNYNSTSTKSNSQNNHSKDCLCLHGKCNTCNGNGWIWAIGSYKKLDCPNCTDGRCRRCNGTGRR